METPVDNIAEKPTKIITPLEGILASSPQRAIGLLAQYQTKKNFGLSHGMDGENKNRWREWLINFASQGLSLQEIRNSQILCLGGVDLAEVNGYISRGFLPKHITTVERNINPDVQSQIEQSLGDAQVEFDSLGKVLCDKKFYVDIASYDFCGQLCQEVIDSIRNTKFWNGKGKLIVNLRHARESSSIQDILSSMSEYLDSDIYNP